MAVYKVPQDVEADDKLIGPFSFRQFVYLIIVALAIAIAWGLAQLFVPLAIIPLPIIIVFGALALPLRKDQPMEVYMAAILSFYLKPRKRLWDSDGIESLIEITVPKTIEIQRTKDLSQNEAQQRFSYLAEIVDTQGWAVRGTGIQAPNSAMKSDVYFEAQQVDDVLDSNNAIAIALNQKLDQNDARKHLEMINMVRGQASTAAPSADMFNYFSGATPAPTTVTVEAPVVEPIIQYNPYPNDIQQSVLQPINASEQFHQPKPPTTSEKVATADIINLASNSDLSIETIARVANRIHDKQELNQEVIVSLR